MPIDLHLLSLPGEDDLRYILAASRPYLERQSQPLVAFIQWASVHNDWLPYTQKAFAGLAEVTALNPAPALLNESESILDRCGVVYISGGNTYLLNHRLHESGLAGSLRQKALNGLPVIGFSAGAMVCGPNLLTTHDINAVPTRHFDGLDLLPYNIAAHYPSDDTAREDEDDWLSDYQAYHTNPILALENDAYVRWDGVSLTCQHGSAWLLRSGSPREKME